MQDNADKPPRPGKKKVKRVFAGDIPFELTDQDIKDIFQTVGPIVNIEYRKNQTTNKREYCFLEYPDYETAESAIRNLNDYNIKGRKLKVNYANRDKTEITVEDENFSDPEDFEAYNADRELCQIVKNLHNNQKHFILTELRQLMDKNPDYFRSLLEYDERVAHMILDLQKDLKLDMQPQDFRGGYNNDNRGGNNKQRRNTTKSGGDGGGGFSGGGGGGFSNQPFPLQQQQSQQRQTQFSNQPHNIIQQQNQPMMNQFSGNNPMNRGGDMGRGQPMGGGNMSNQRGGFSDMDPRGGGMNRGGNFGMNMDNRMNQPNTDYTIKKKFPGDTRVSGGVSGSGDSNMMQGGGGGGNMNVVGTNMNMNQNFNSNRMPTNVGVGNVNQGKMGFYGGNTGGGVMNPVPNNPMMNNFNTMGGNLGGNMGVGNMGGNLGGMNPGPGGPGVAPLGGGNMNPMMQPMQNTPFMQNPQSNTGGVIPNKMMMNQRGMPNPMQMPMQMGFSDYGPIGPSSMPGNFPMNPQQVMQNFNPNSKTQNNPQGPMGGGGMNVMGGRGQATSQPQPYSNFSIHTGSTNANMPFTTNPQGFDQQTMDMYNRQGQQQFHPGMYGQQQQQQDMMDYGQPHDMPENMMDYDDINLDG
jgi:cleavage stimulation factor subunit 2